MTCNPFTDCTVELYNFYLTTLVAIYQHLLTHAYAPMDRNNRTDFIIVELVLSVGIESSNTHQIVGCFAEILGTENLYKQIKFYVEGYVRALLGVGRVA